jgi:hypothetical protein
MSNTTTKRKGRGRSAKSMILIEAARRILQEIQPCSIRAVCYRIFTQKMIPDMGKKSTGAVGAQLVFARETGLIPWTWIVDETRAAETVASWDNPEEIIETAVAQYRKDYWAMQPRRVEVWSEKGTIRGTVAPILKRYGVTFRVLHGYGSATSIHGIATETQRSDKPMTVFYIGDHDPSGRHMSEVDLPDRLARYGGSATITRLALDNTDVGADSTLPWFPVGDKINDSRYQWFIKRFGQRCWEVDALPPPVLRERLDGAIAMMLDLDAWRHAVKIEKAETDSMQNIMSYFKASISGLDPKYSDGGRHG